MKRRDGMNDMNMLRIAEATLELEEKALRTGSQKHYQRAVGFIDGLKRAGFFGKDTASAMIKDFRSRWKEKNRKTVGSEEARKNFRRMWSYTP